MASRTVGSTFVNGARLPNFVNGRLLAAEDLATGQTTLQSRDTEVARDAGHGVVDGLWVTAGAASLTVAAGLGFPPAGEPVCLPSPVSLPLSSATTTAAPTGVGFADCSVGAGGTQNAVGPGAYLLTASPACQLQGTAPMAPTPGSNAPQACTAQWEVAGVQFKAIALPVGTTVDGEEITDANRRNLVAHWCYGTGQLAQLPVEFFSFDPAYAGFDQLDPADLTPCDLPLAVFCWDNDRRRQGGGVRVGRRRGSCRRRRWQPERARSARPPGRWGSCRPPGRWQPEPARSAVPAWSAAGPASPRRPRPRSERPAGGSPPGCLPQRPAGDRLPRRRPGRPTAPPLRAHRQ